MVAAGISTILRIRSQGRAADGVRRVRARRRREAGSLELFVRHQVVTTTSSVVSDDRRRRQRTRPPEEALARAVKVRRRMRRVGQVGAEDGAAGGVADDEHVACALAAVRVLPAVLVQRRQRRAVALQAVG